MNRALAILLFCLVAPLAMADSSRVMPTVYDTATLGGAARTYQSVNVWEAATQGNLVTGGRGKVLECYADGDATYDQSFTIAGSITNATLFRVLKAAAGHEYVFATAAGFAFAYDTAAAVDPYYVGEDNFGLYDLGFTLVGQNHATIAAAVYFVAGKSGYRMVGCTVFDCINAGSGTYDGVELNGAGTFINCLFVDNDRVGWFAQATGGTNLVYNCTAIGGQWGYYAVAAGDTNTAINCIAQGFSTAGFDGSFDATTTCTTSGVTFVGGDDYHLAAGDTVARGNGTDLSATFTDDIDGDTRSAWDIGPDEYQGAPAATGGKRNSFF